MPSSHASKLFHNVLRIASDKILDVFDRSVLDAKQCFVGVKRDVGRDDHIRPPLQHIVINEQPQLLLIARLVQQFFLALNKLLAL